jgi:hypothetical protein
MLRERLAPADATTLPVRKPGRPSPAAAALYQAHLTAWCSHIIELQSRLDFRVNSRGWCYLLENDNAQKLVNDCRKSGDLPLD